MTIYRVTTASGEVFHMELTAANVPARAVFGAETPGPKTFWVDCLDDYTLEAHHQSLHELASRIAFGLFDADDPTIPEDGIVELMGSGSTGAGRPIVEHRPDGSVLRRPEAHIHFPGLRGQAQSAQRQPVPDIGVGTGPHGPYVKGPQGDDEIRDWTHAHTEPSPREHSQQAREYTSLRRSLDAALVTLTQDVESALKTRADPNATIRELQEHMKAARMTFRRIEKLLGVS